MPDVAVAGAGLIGLSIALELAKRGADVSVYDEREPARAASWAGAGMLAPYSEDVDDDLFALCVASLERYPTYVAELRERTGIDAELRRDGHLHLAHDPPGEGRLDALAAHLQSRGVRHEILDRRETLTREPAAGAGVRRSLFIPDEAQVDNRRLGRALHAACRALGVRIDSERGRVVLEADERRVRGLRTPDGFVATPVVINAAGAWAGELDGVPAHARIPVVPVAGQMVALAVPRGFVRHAVWPTASHYWVPREDGRLLIGATVEHRGFDARVTAAGVASLLATALAASPALGDFTVSETWAGIRPGSPDHRPFLGPTSLEGYLVASGHYRNGILLAPITGEVIADAVEGRGPALALGPFAPARLSHAEPAAVRANRG